MIFKRREFLQTSTLATASLMLPKFLKAYESGKTVPPGNKVFVVVQFSGGNDGLNTVVPISNDIYYKARPSIAIKKDAALRLTDDAGLNPALTSLKALYDEGSLGILNSVGYPEPDRSHFRSMDIWHSASKSDEFLNTGWLGRYLDAQCLNCDKPTQALEIDDTLSLALKGDVQKALALRDPRRLYSASNEKFYRDINAAHQQQHEEETVSYLYKTMSATLSSADYIFDQSKMRPTKASYPGSQFGQSLKTISSLIQSDINTKVYYVSLGSFDTHVGQEGRQKQLFTEFNDAMAVFTKDLKAAGRFDDVLVMTFSEFGRRVGQNASNGTDHGTANNMFFIGGGLKQKGLLNPMTDLANLNEGDLIYKVDFKDVYATILNNWLRADANKIIGHGAKPMSFV